MDHQVMDTTEGSAQVPQAAEQQQHSGSTLGSDNTNRNPAERLCGHGLCKGCTIVDSMSLAWNCCACGGVALAPEAKKNPEKAWVPKKAFVCEKPYTGPRAPCGHGICKGCMIVDTMSLDWKCCTCGGVTLAPKAKKDPAKSWVCEKGARYEGPQTPESWMMARSSG